MIAHIGGVPVEEVVYLLAAGSVGFAAVIRWAWSGVRRRREPAARQSQWLRRQGRLGGPQQ